jgi:ribosomal protein S6--L-glutamate ligase
MEIGVIGVPGGWSSERLVDEVEEQTGFRLLIDPEYIYFDSRGNSVYYQDTNLMDLDAVIIKKIGPRYSADLLNRLELLHFLEEKGLRTFSSARSIIQSFNRLNGTLRLQLGNIPMPDTTIVEDVNRAVEIIREYGKAIMKPLFSTKARGMVVVKGDDPDLEDKVVSFKSNGNTSMYIQKMVHVPGKDLGVAFLGGEYMATYARVANENSWNTTINDGGRYEPYEPSGEIIELARKAQALYGLDFTSVDVVETEEGPMVFEVSAFGGFRGLLEANKIDAAKKYVEYVINRIS